MGDTATLKPVDETDALLTRLRDLVRVRNMFGQQVPTNVVDAVLRGEVDLAGVISNATYERVRDAVEVGAPAELTMKGQPHPFSMYPVLGSTPA